MAERNERAMAQRIGQRIKQRREEAKQTQSQLALYADVTRSWLARVEAGDFTDIGVVRLLRVARQLGCSLEDLTSEPLADDMELIPVARDKAPLMRRIMRHTRDAIAEAEFIAGRWAGRVESEAVDDVHTAGADDRGEQHDGEQPPATGAVDATCR